VEAPQVGGRFRVFAGRAILQENRKATFPDRAPERDHFRWKHHGSVAALDYLLARAMPGGWRDGDRSTTRKKACPCKRKGQAISFNACNWSRYLAPT